MGKRPQLAQTGTEEVWFPQRKGQEAGIWRELGRHILVLFLGGWGAAHPQGLGEKVLKSSLHDQMLCWWLWVARGREWQGPSWEQPEGTGVPRRTWQGLKSGKLGKHWDSQGGPPFSVKWDHHHYLTSQVSCNFWIKTFVNTASTVKTDLWKNHFSIKNNTLKSSGGLEGLWSSQIKLATKNSQILKWFNRRLSWEPTLFPHKSSCFLDVVPVGKESSRCCTQSSVNVPSGESPVWPPRHWHLPCNHMWTWTLGRTTVSQFVSDL